MAKILLVEDDAIQVELIKKHLEPIGYDVIVAKNGQEGIKLAEKQKPDLILMDMIMSGMHGLEVTIKLKESPQTQHIPIIALTIMSSPKFIQECYRAGIISYIKKPYDPKALLESVEKIIGKPTRRFTRVMMITGASRLATMIEMRLLREGYQVNTFAGGKGALSHIKIEKPDVIFLDISLPEKHVSLVFEELRKSEMTQAIPVILLATHLSKEETEAEVSRWGARNSISSAADLTEVLHKIKGPTIN
jgi:CheY-like chemotaxis protein